MPSKVPKSHFQSQLLTSKIIRIFLKIFGEKYQFRGIFFEFTNFVTFVPNISKKKLAFLDSYVGPFNKSHKKLMPFFHDSAIMISISNVIVKFC